MTKLPNSWAVVPIAEVLEPNRNGKPFQQGWSPQCKSHPAPDEKWGVLRTTAIQPGKFLEYENKELPETLEPRTHIEVKLGDLLMTCAGPRSRCGVVCLVERTRPKLMISGKMYRFRPNTNAVLPRFLSYFIQSRQAQNAIDAMKTGISDSGLNLTHDRFSTLEIPLAPVAEQRRIVASIEQMFSEIDKAVESLTVARAQLAVYRKSVLKQALTGKLTAGFRARRAEKLRHASELITQIADTRVAKREKALRDWENAPRQDRGQRPRNAVVAELSDDNISELETLPDNWGWHSLSELADHITDGTHKTPSYTTHGIPFLSAKDIYDFRINFDDSRFISATEHDDLSKRCRVEPGNVLITKSGTIGRVAVVDTGAPFSLFESVANVPVFDLMNSRFVCIAVYFIIETFFGRRNQKGVAVRHLHLEDIRRLPIPVTDRLEQDEIMRLVESVFSEIDQLENTIESALVQSEIQKYAILDRAFAGRLVQQHKADEPASSVLERVRTQRAHGATDERSNKKNNAKKEAA